jgi:porin
MRAMRVVVLVVAGGLSIGLGSQAMAQSNSDAPADTPTEPSWLDGDHATGTWGGARSDLANRGVQIDVVYASDLFTARGQGAALGHVDAAVTLDTQKLGLWDGGTLYVLGQNNHGSGINDQVGSAQPVTNLEAEPYTQLTELFYEQALFDQKLRIRIGKQDANREFGTPRFGGNFINNNFGMFPNAPLPSYPTTGLGAFVAVAPVAWLVGKAAVFEGSPQIGGFGLTNAFHEGAGHTVVGSAAVTHHEGADGRHGGTTSAGAWRQTGEFAELGDLAIRMFDSNAGFFLQHDERIYLHPQDANDPRGLTVIVRYSWARADRSAIASYVGGSVAWHGVGFRTNDTVGIGAGSYTLAEPMGGTAGSPARSRESFLEAFYKMRLTAFASIQPDLQWFHHPGGAGADAWVGGVRLKLKL